MPQRAASPWDRSQTKGKHYVVNLGGITVDPPNDAPYDPAAVGQLRAKEILGSIEWQLSSISRQDALKVLLQAVQTTKARAQDQADDGRHAPAGIPV
jgi:hypothetical protein